MVVAWVAITDCITSLPSASSTATEMVLWWTSRPIYLMLSIGCSFREVGYCSAQQPNPTAKGAPFYNAWPNSCASFANEWENLTIIHRDSSPRGRCCNNSVGIRSVFRRPGLAFAQTRQAGTISRPVAIQAAASYMPFEGSWRGPGYAVHRTWGAPSFSPAFGERVGTISGRVSRRNSCDATSPPCLCATRMGHPRSLRLATRRSYNLREIAQRQAQQACRIEVRPFPTNAHVEGRAGSSAGGTAQPDLLALSHFLPFGNFQSRQMHVHGHEPFSVIDDHAVAFVEQFASQHHLSGICCQHWRSWLGPEIHATMNAHQLAIENPARAKRVRDHGTYWSKEISRPFRGRNLVRESDALGLLIGFYSAQSCGVRLHKTVRHPKRHRLVVGWAYRNIPSHANNPSIRHCGDNIERVDSRQGFHVHSRSEE